MRKGALLTEAQLDQALHMLPGWKVVKGKLHKEFKFRSFGEAMGFMVSAAIAAEAINHHPEWFNVYNRVVVDLVTHDLHGISSWDVALAQKMDSLAAHD